MFRKTFTDFVTLAQAIVAFRHPSLRRVVHDLHREHLRRNSEAKLLRYGLLRQILAVVGQRPVSALTMVSIFYLAVAGITAAAPWTEFGPQVPGSVGDFYRDIQAVNFALLGAQATLLGLVYPLIIALVGLLFEARSSRGGRLQVYFKETEAAVVGLMSLTLIGWVTLQGLLYSQILEKVAAALTILNSLWFVTNLAALGFFVYRSLEFIRPEPRLRLLRSYIANSTWPTQLREVTVLGQPAFNYAAMEWRWGSLASDWALAYRPILSRITDQLPAESRFFEVSGYLAVRLYRRARKVAPFEATKPIFLQPTILQNDLLKSAARRRPDPLARKAGASFNLEGRYGDLYREAWHDLVAAWEALIQEAGRPDQGDRASRWAALQAVAPAVRYHLRETAMMVARAAKVGESEAVGWTVDMLLKWRSTAQRAWDVHGHRAWHLRGPMITLSILERDWTGVLQMPISDDPARLQVNDVFDAAFENAWLDTLVVLVSNLMGLMGEPVGGLLSNGPAIAGGNIFRNKSHDPMAAAHPRQAPLEEASILRAILRLVGSGHSFEHNYGSEIGQIAEAVDQLEGPNYISGRIYSWSGGAEIHGQADPQIVLLAASLRPIDRRRRPPPITLSRNTLCVLVPPDDSDRRRILDHLKAMRVGVKEVDAARVRDLVSTLTGKAITPLELGQRLAAVENLLQSSQGAVEAARAQALAASVPDAAYLLVLADAAQDRAFAKKSAAFPVNQFSSIESAPGPLPRSVQKTSARRRGSYTIPTLDARDGDEPDWWRKNAPAHVASVILSDIAEAKPGALRRPRNSLGYWNALKRGIAAVEAAGQTPIIVHPSPSEPACLLHWAISDPVLPRPPDMVITELDAHESDHDFLVNGVPVYSRSGAAGVTLVFGQESLERVVFERLPDGHLVEMRFLVDGANPWNGWLEIGFGRQVTLGTGPFWRISHGLLR